MDIDTAAIAAQRQQLHDRADHDLVNHAPRSGPVHAALDGVTATCQAAAHQLIELVPPGRELSLALTAIESASQAAKAGIARNQGVVEAMYEVRPGD